MKRMLGFVLHTLFLLALSLLEIGGSNEDSGTARQPLRTDFEGWHSLPEPPPPPDIYQAGPAQRIDFIGKHKKPEPLPPAKPYESSPPMRIDFFGKHVRPVPPSPSEQDKPDEPLSTGFQGKGYWHNRNGLAELLEDDRDYINSLLPYRVPSAFFVDGDEPFDGLCSDGTPVAAAFIRDVSENWGTGTWRAEISHFLVDANTSSDPRGELAQELLAFIFNTRHRLGDLEASIELPDGSLTSAASMINGAVTTWAAGVPDVQREIKGLLNELNENESVNYYLPNAS